MTQQILTEQMLLDSYPNNSTRLIIPQTHRNFVLSAFGQRETRDPNNTDDAFGNSVTGNFFDFGSWWTNTATPSVWRCISGAANAATWIQLTPSGGILSVVGPLSVSVNTVAGVVTVELVNDDPAPGPNMVYGADAIGTKGWKADPGGGGGGAMNGARVSSGGAVLLSNTWTDLVYTVTDYDTSAYFDGVSTFTVPSTGYYAIGGLIYFGGGGMANYYNYNRVWINNLTMVASSTCEYDPGSQTDPFGFTSNQVPNIISTQVFLNAGDTVQLQGWTGCVFNVQCYGGGNFWIQYLGS